MIYEVAYGLYWMCTYLKDGVVAELCFVEKRSNLFPDYLVYFLGTTS